MMKFPPVLRYSKIYTITSENSGNVQIMLKNFQQWIFLSFYYGCKFYIL